MMKNRVYIYLIASLTILCGELDADTTPSELPVHTILYWRNKNYSNPFFMDSELASLLDSQKVDHALLDSNGLTAANYAVLHCMLSELERFSIQNIEFDEDKLLPSCRKILSGMVFAFDEKRINNIVTSKKKRHRIEDSFKLVFLAQ